MLIDIPWDALPLIGLYAETHYRFRFFPFSIYHRRQPEVIFDAPHRVEPGAPLPVSLIVKDAHRFPVRLLRATLNVSDGARQHSFGFKLGEDGDSRGSGILPEDIADRIWFQIFDLDLSGFASGLLAVDCTLEYQRRGRRHLARNDNHPGLSHQPLAVYHAAHPLPVFPGWHAGELHCHTSLGEDQVEFGAPLKVYQAAARAMGLGWVALTDHSYNLDDRLDNCLKNDPDLPRWKALHDEAAQLSRNGDVLFLPGEELSCRSSEGRNVHLIILGNGEFLPGSGDGAERWFRTRSELSVEEALAKLPPEAVAIAAHPFADTPFLERLLVHRGSWQPDDLARSRLDGWQIANDSADLRDRRGIKEWVQMLLKGERIPISGGNDAHGNLNRFRQVKLPMVKLWERSAHLFGRVTTRVLLSSGVSESALLSAFKRGATAVSDGPMVELTVEQDGRRIASGGVASIKAGGSIRVRALSTPEFGRLNRLRVFTGGAEGEINLSSTPDNEGFRARDAFQWEETIQLRGQRYIRAEILTALEDGSSRACIANPVWLDD